jgi:nucleotide-binding universal stress UspA family protein
LNKGCAQPLPTEATMPQRILLAVDDSKHARKAADVVERLAKDTGAEVSVIHIHEIAVGRWGRLRVDDNNGDEFAKTIVRELTDAGVPAKLLSRESYLREVAQAIVAAADEIDADLIAVGSRGHSDVHSLALGSVSHKVLHITDRPILVVPAA